MAKLIINGHWKYNLLFRNCEHFVNWIIYGINFSEQVQYWKTKLLGKRLAEKKINLKKEIMKNDRLIDSIKIKNQAELINKIKEIREYTQ